MSEVDGVKEKAGNPGPVASDHEQSLAQAALADFNRENYTSCLSNLNVLEITWAQDSKLAHNTAVVEYYISGLKDTEQFQKKLNAVRAQPCYNNEECIGLDDVEHCALYYNHAVLLFHMKKYNLSLNIIKQESLAHKVCLLLLELLICLRRVDEALEHIGYITLQFASTKNIQILEEPAEKKPVVFDAATDAFRRKLLIYKTRCYLLSGYTDGAARELQVIDSLGGGKRQATLFLYAQLEYLLGNFDHAIDILETAQKTEMRTYAECGISPLVFLNNNLGCLHQKVGKYNLASYMFREALLEHEKVMKTFTGSPARSLLTLNGNNIAQLMYNIGVSQLFANRPVNAFDFLLQAVQVYHLNPRLWLRMAECAIRAYKDGNEDEFAMFARRKDIVGSVFGSGIHRKLILANQSSPVKSGTGVSAAIPAPTLEFAALCLKNAIMLLPEEVEGERRDSWVSPPSTPTPTKMEKKASTRCSMYGAPSSLLCDSEVQALRVSALTSSSYVALCLGDYIMALEYAEMVLREKCVPGAHQTLAHLYAAEALLLLNLRNEAIEHLNPDHVLDLDISLQNSDPDQSSPYNKAKREWYPDKALTGKMIMQFNMAAAFAIRGELDRAGELLKFIWSIKMKADIPLKIVMLALYIELQLGHAENAKSILKQHFPLL